MVKKAVYKCRQWGKRVLSLFLILSIVLTATSCGSLMGRTVTIEPTLANEEGLVSPNTEFIITPSRAIEEEDFRDNLTIDPHFPFQLTEEDDGSYLLTPVFPLEGDEVTFTYGNNSYTFQLDAALGITSSFPANSSTGVPVSSGIEFTFNGEVDRDDFIDAFSILPEVEGSFSVTAGRYIFYPYDIFQYDTLYTVSLSGALADVDGNTLGSDYVFTFETESKDGYMSDATFRISGESTLTRNFLTTETPLIQVSMDSKVAENPVDVTVYRIDTWEDYYDSLTAQMNTSKTGGLSAFTTDELTEHATFQVDPIPAIQGGESYYYYENQWVLDFPDILPEGWYAVNFTAYSGEKAIERYMFLQVSDLSVFYMLSDESLLVWVNDAATGDPVEDAEFIMSGARETSGKTGKDGTLLLQDVDIPKELESEKADGIFTIQVGNQAFVDTRNLYNYSYTNPNAMTNYYMSYLFCDRPIYHTTDTIQFWGTIKARYSDPPALEDLKVQLSNEGAEAEITLLGDGTFTASLSFENMASTYWTSLQLMAGDEILASTYLRIEDFVKPIYTASTETDKPVYLGTEDKTANITVSVSTFDGTPAAAFPVSISGWSELSISDRKLETDEQGIIEIEASLGSGTDTWYPQHYSYYASNDEAEDENFYIYGGVYHIPRDVMLVAKPEVSNTESLLHVSTNRIDISGVETTSDLWEKDILKGEALSQTVTAEVHHEYYTKTKTGSYYDFINRVSLDSYHYTHHDDVIDTFEFTTGADGTVTIDNLPVIEDNDCYYVILTTKDSAGKTVKTTSYLCSVWYRNTMTDDGMHRYVLNKEVNLDAVEPLENEGGYYYPYNTWSTFDDSESVTFLLEDNDEAVEEMPGRILYGIVQNRIYDVKTSDKATFTLPFSENLVPNYVITGAYFDGERVYTLDNKYMSFNSSSRELEVKLTTDKEVYRPGEEISVAALVTDTNTGDPVNGASIVLSTVDEAVFALQEQSINILSTLYASIYYPNIKKYTSYIQVNFDTAGEKGGGGGEDEMRTDFQDTAYFSTATTGSDGTASFTFTLPDNITCWRLTSLAICPKNHAGSTKININATKEFFLMPILNETIIEGDSFAVGVRGSGSGVVSTDETSYTVRIEGEGVDETKQITSPLRTYASTLFDGLTEGDYTVTISGTCEGYSDAIQLPFQVIPSGLEISLVKTFDLSEGLAVDPLRYPVGVSIYNRAYTSYNQVFRSLRNWGARSDTRLARFYMALKFEEWGDSWYDNGALEEDLSDLSASNSLISLFPYSNPDVELSVKAWLAMPDYFRITSGDWLGPDDTWFDGSTAAVYLAHAIAGEDLPDKLEDWVTEDSSLTYTEKIYLSLALAVSGDTAAATRCYNELVTPHLKEERGISGIRIQSVDITDGDLSVLDCTAAASMLASVLSTDEAEELALYLAVKKSYRELYNLEQMIFLTYHDPVTSPAASFSFTRDGETVTETLSRGITSYNLTKDQLENADFTVLSGEVYTDVYYAGSLDEVSDESEKLLTIERKIEPVGSDIIEVGTLVKVTLTPGWAGLSSSIGSSHMIIDEYIPSGLRFERYQYGSSTGSSRGWYLSSRQGQRLQYSAYGSFLLTPIVYYARCAVPGEYIVESAYISSSNSEIWGISERETIVIE